MIYFDFIEIEEILRGDNRLEELDRHFLERVYSTCEAIMDARRDTGATYYRSIYGTVWRLQRRVAIRLWLMGHNEYESWVPWWRKTLHAVWK